MERAITISREFGSGGRELGVRLAESLGIPFYDKELISMAAEESDMPEDAFLHYDENMPLIKDPLDRHFYSPFSSIYQVPMSDQNLFSTVQSDPEAGRAGTLRDRRTVCGYGS